MKLTKTQKNFMTAFIVGLLIFFLMPAKNGLTPEGVRMLSVFIPVIFLWLTEGGSGWSALLGCTMIVMLGAYDGALSYQMFWGGSMVAMIIPFYMMANALEESGAMLWVVRWILSRKVLHGRPTLFTIFFVMALLLTSVLVNPMVTVVIFFKILKDLTASVGMDRDSDFYRAHGLLISWIGQTCDGCLIWGRPFILSMFAMIVGFGYDHFTMNDFFKVSAIYLFFVCIIGVLIVKLWIRPDCSAFKNFNDAAIREELKRNPMTKRAKVLLTGMAVVVAAYIAAFMTPLGAIQQYFNGLPVAAPISLIAALMCLLVIDGKPVLDIGREMARLPWNTIMFLGSVMFFGGIVGSEQFGISAMLSHMITPIVTKLPAALAVFIGLAAASVLTNLTSNAVSAIVVLSCFVPAMLAAPNISNAQVLAFAVCVVTICATAVATLAACATMSLVYCPEGIPYKPTAKYSIVLCIIMVVVSAFVIVPLGSVLFGGIV